MAIMPPADELGSVLEGDDRAKLEREALPKFLQGQRWFPGKARGIASARILDAAQPDGFPPGAILALVEVRFHEGESDVYFVPMSVAAGAEADRLCREGPARVIACLEHGDGRHIVAYDGLSDPVTCRALLMAIERNRTIPLRHGEIRGLATSAYHRARGPAGAPLEVVWGKAEQSNSAVLFDHRLLLKIIRRVEPGISPDYEIGKFLSERTGFDRIPKTAGTLEYHRHGAEPGTLGILQELVANQGTGWEHCLHELRRFFQGVPSGAVPAGVDPTDLDRMDPSIRHLLGTYPRAALTLGRRTAELHRALSSGPRDPDFAPEPLTAADLTALRDDIRDQFARTLDVLKASTEKLPEAIRAGARRVLEEAPGFQEQLDHLPALTPGSTKIRCHGDYHLGQVLRTEDDFVILDFEGEPVKSLARRRAKQSPIKDVVGMLRSFDYAVNSALQAFTADQPDEAERLRPWARFWRAAVSSAFLQGYRATAQDAAFLPAEPGDFDALLRAFTLDKALYELLYELNNRPDWVNIPLQGVLDLLERAPAAPPAAPEVEPPAPVRPALIAGSRLTDFDLHLLNEGTHYRSYEKLGAHLVEWNGTAGTNFAVWAPNARAVSVIGDFNNWDPDASPMHRRGSGGIWERFVPGADRGGLYKYAIVTADGHRVEKADPYAFASEPRPQTGSVIADLSGYTWGDAAWLAARRRRDALATPISIYELHLGSWMRMPEEGDRWLTYREVAPKLADYVAEMGFTHVELLPITEHPFDGSWGYQTTGYFAPTSRFGAPHDLMFLIDTLHRRGIGVILDWVPAHFPNDPHGLGVFDGTHLYEHADPRRGIHPDWNSYIFNYGRPEVVNFLISSALFWLDKYHVDGLRVDAVTSMLHLDYSRKPGEWAPNEFGGRENLEAITFLWRFNERVHAEFPGVLTIAEEATAWPMVSRPTTVGGLGFSLKWDMGWMNDTLQYMGLDPVFRKHHHNLLTFRGLYAFNENFVLPLSHDEVVYGKGSLLSKMPGDTWRQFANLRLLFGWMHAQPGKKLLFMGDEFGQEREWNHDRSLDWHLVHDPLHSGLRRWVRDLNTLYRGEPGLFEWECRPDGFAWADVHDAEQSAISLFRRGPSPQDLILIACNFTPIPRHNYRIGVPRSGHWDEILNSDATLYGGSGQGNIGGVRSAPVPWHGQNQSVNLTLPPLGLIALKWRGR